MSKGLEALEKLKRYYIEISDIITIYVEDSKECETIEKELKEYEQLSDEFQEFVKRYNKLCQEKIEWLKQKKALEIIKNKEVNVFILLHSGNLETYNDMVEDNRKLTQEEYDLLKEVLLCH